jgi:hypothetical protein
MSEVKTEKLQDGEMGIEELKDLLGVNGESDPFAHDRLELDSESYAELREIFKDGQSESTEKFVNDMVNIYSMGYMIGMSRAEIYELLITKLTFDHNIKVSELSVEMAKEQSKAIQVAQDKEMI